MDQIIFFIVSSYMNNCKKKFSVSHELWEYQRTKMFSQMVRMHRSDDAIYNIYITKSGRL